MRPIVGDRHAGDCRRPPCGRPLLILLTVKRNHTVARMAASYNQTAFQYG